MSSIVNNVFCFLFRNIPYFFNLTISNEVPIPVQNINFLRLSDSGFVSNSKVISMQSLTARLRDLLTVLVSYQKPLDLYDVV